MSGDVEQTIYTHDASGNAMAVYEYTDDGVNPTCFLTESYIYGGKRLGIYNRNVDMEATYTPPSTETRVLGNRNYEMSNHLNNVLNVISDRMLTIDGNSDNFTDYYMADVISYCDYTPFGVEMEGRQGANANARFGFQGQERDNEIKGNGNSVNYKYRMHDPRIGRFFAVDPLAPKYPHYTPYSFSGNKVIACRELEGMEEFHVNKDFVNRPDGSVFIKYNIRYVSEASTLQVRYRYNGGVLTLVDGTFSTTGFGAGGNWLYGSFESTFDTPNSSWTIKTWHQAAHVNEEMAHLNNPTSSLVQSSHLGQVRTMRQAYLTDNKYYNTGTQQRPYPEKWVEQRDYLEISTPNILYENDESLNTEDNISKINQSIDWMIMVPELTLSIVGNTSQYASSGYNQTLSQERAQGIYNLYMNQLDLRLANNSITQEQYDRIKSQITWMGAGETNAQGSTEDTNGVYDGTNETNNSTDRNVEFNYLFVVP